MSEDKSTVEFNLFEDFTNVDEENIIVGVVKQAVEESQNKEPVKKSRKIEDFGEKIGGARKDLYAAYFDLIKVALKTEIEAVPLSKSFPVPNYKKLLESELYYAALAFFCRKLFLKVEKVFYKKSFRGDKKIGRNYFWT